MPPLLNQGSRPLASPALAASPQAQPQAAGKPAGSQRPQATERDSSVRLSAQALAGAASDTGKSTVGVARDFVASMAEAIFGKQADGATLQFDSVSLDSSASFSASATYANGVAGASVSLNESAHFIGTGQLTLENGQTYDFEVEVKYQASAEASVQVQSPDVILAGKQLPAIKYPGGIEDLFKLLGREMSTEQGDPGKLTLRLMRLVDRAALLAPRLHDEPAPAARQQAANAYASAGAAEV